jgi:hypothetical protein
VSIAADKSIVLDFNTVTPTVSAAIYAIKFGVVAKGSSTVLYTLPEYIQLPAFE